MTNVFIIGKKKGGDITKNCMANNNNFKTNNISDTSTARNESKKTLGRKQKKDQQNVNKTYGDNN